MPSVREGAPGSSGDFGVGSSRRSSPAGRLETPPGSPRSVGHVLGSASVSCQRIPCAADVCVGDVAVEGDRVGQCLEGGRLRVDARVQAEGFGKLAEHEEARADVAGALGARADALQAAVGVGDGAVFLGVGLEREEDVGLGGGRGLEGREGDDELGGVERLGPGRRVGEVAQRVDADQDQALDLAGLQRVADLLGAPCRRRTSASPGPASGRQPASRRPRALANSGTSSRPAPSVSPIFSAARQSRPARSCAMAPIRSPQRTTTLPASFSVCASGVATVSSPPSALVSSPTKWAASPGA